MEILGIILFIVLLTAIAATVSALLKDGRGHNPPINPKEAGSVYDAHCNTFWNPRIY